MDDIKREIISKWILENNISEIECLVPDITGNARGKFIPAKKFLKQESRLPEGILAQTVTGEYSEDFWDLLGTIAVSYTHLTLPTICSV